jgi:hypothetical protein
MKTLLIVACFIPFMYACQSNDDAGQLYHSPKGEVGVTISNTIIKVDFSLDENMRSVITSEIGRHKIEYIKTREELLYFYKTLRPYFQPGYSSLGDDNDYVFAKVEYLLAQECFQDECSSQTRRDVLETVVDMQKHKFGVAYVSPSFTRRTGTFLIAVILLKEGDNSFAQALISNVELQKTLICLNNNTWMDEEKFNILLIQYAETFLSNK